MLRKLQSLFTAERPAKNEEEAKRMALAVLLFETSRMDATLLGCERRMSVQALRQYFGLGEAEAERLVAAAEKEAGATSDYHRYTDCINRGFSAEEKVGIVESLWRVAYADGELDKHEEYLIRKVARLIGVSHRDFIAAKRRASGKAPG